MGTLARATCSGSVTFLLPPWPTLRSLPLETSRATLARSSMTSTRPPTSCSPIPQGDHKKRAKYRFASKTLMRILPAKEKAEVEGLIEKKTITLDLYEILGKCTWTPV